MLNAMMGCIFLVFSTSPPLAWSNPKFVSNSLVNKDNDIFVFAQNWLGHPNFIYLEKLFSSLFSNKSSRFIFCDVCQLSKHMRATFSPQPYKSSQPFSLIHIDIWGSSNINVAGHRWFLLFTDDHTRESWVFFMKEKSETSALFRQFMS